MSVKDQLRGLGGKEVKSEPFDLHVEIEVLQDVANGISAGYFHYAKQNGLLELGDHPVNAAHDELWGLKDDIRKCRTKEEIDRIDKVLDGYSKRLTELRGEIPIVV